MTLHFIVFPFSLIHSSILILKSTIAMPHTIQLISCILASLSISLSYIISLRFWFWWINGMRLCFVNKRRKHIGLYWFVLFLMLVSFDRGKRIIKDCIIDLFSFRFWYRIKIWRMMFMVWSNIHLLTFRMNCDQIFIKACLSLINWNWKYTFVWSSIANNAYCNWL